MNLDILHVQVGQCPTCQCVYFGDGDVDADILKDWVDILGNYKLSC